MHGLSISPTDPNKMVAGLDEGGAFMTTDGAKSWRVLGQSGPQPHMQPGLGGLWCSTFDPGNSMNVWIGSGFGVSKSSDGGATWALSLGGDPSYAISAITVDPGNSSVVYASSGPYVTNDGCNSNTYHGPNGNVWKTTDGGTTWTSLATPDGPKGQQWNRILIDPLSTSTKADGHSRVYLAGPGGLYLSTNAGTSWDHLTSSPGANATTCPIGSIDLQFLSAPAGATVTPLIGSFEVSGTGKIETSTDGGKTWTDVSSGLTSADHNFFLGVSGSVVYAAAAGNGNGAYSGNNVYRSDTQGGGWSLITHQHIDYVDDFVIQADGGNFSNLDYFGATNISALAVSPTNPMIVAYTNEGGMELSTDGGATWTQPLFDYGATFGAPSVQQQWPPGFSTHEPLPGTNLMTSRGVQIIVNETIAVDPFYPNTVAIGYDDVGLHISRDGATSWAWSYLGMTDDGAYNGSDCHNINAVVYDPNVKGQLFAAANNRYAPIENVYQSTDDGYTFTAWKIPQLVGASGAGASIEDLAMDPTQKPPAPFGLYAATTQGLYLTTDGGSTWSDVSPVAGKTVSKLATDPSGAHPATIYAALGGTSATTSGEGLYVSTNQGATFTELGSFGNVFDLSVCSPAPTSPNAILVVATKPGAGYKFWGPNALYLSTDAGSSWTTLTDLAGWPNGGMGGVVENAAFNPANCDMILVTTSSQYLSSASVGLWLSRDQGTTFSEGDKGMALTFGGGGSAISPAHYKIAFDPASTATSSHFFVGHSAGVYEGWDPGSLVAP